MFSSRAMLDKHVQLRHSMEAQSHDTLTVRYNAFLASSFTENLFFFLLLFFSLVHLAKSSLLHFSLDCRTVEFSYHVIMIHFLFIMAGRQR